MGFEHETGSFSIPLETGISAKSLSVFNCSVFHTEQVRAPGKTQVTDMNDRTGQDKAGNQAKKG